MGKSVKGLFWQRTSDAIRAFINRNGGAAPRRAVLLTYDLDLPRFEAVLLPELTRRGKQFRTLVMADAGALQAHLSEIGTRGFARYEVAPVRCRRAGVFHAKLVFLAVGPRRLVGVGSANLTTGGLGGNLELMLFADDRTDAGRQLVAGTAAFLEALTRTPGIHIPESARTFLRLAVAGVSSAPDGALLHSLAEPLLDQMSRVCLKADLGLTTRVSVLSPWHSQARSPDATDPSMIQRIQRSLGKPVRLYTDGREGAGPNVGHGTEVFVRTERSVADGDEDWFDRRPLRVHAKAYLVEGQRANVLFFGSANCTHPALSMSAGKGGNVELLIASNIDEHQVSALRTDLADLFAQASRHFTPKPAPRLAAPKGNVLCGRLVDTQKGKRLELEAPALSTGSVSIAGRKGSHPVVVQIRRGVGSVMGRASIRRLFGEQTPGRMDASRGTILWERIDRNWLPFAVSVPLIGAGGFEPEALLTDLLYEEMGAWPAAANEGRSDEEPETVEKHETDLMDEDLEALAEARHQGHLDRLAVCVALLRRRILRSSAGPAYARDRIDMLRRQLRRMEMPAHLRRVVLAYLQAGRR